MSTLRGIHTEGIWTLALNENFTLAFSAGRDHHIYATELLTFKSYLVAIEPDPIIRVRFAFALRILLWCSIFALFLLLPRAACIICVILFAKAETD